MRRNLIALLILAAGTVAGYQAAKLWGQLWFLLPFGIGTALAYAVHLEEIKTTSWHYRLTYYYSGDDLNKLCKACPYWGLFLLSIFKGVVEVIYNIVIEVGSHLCYYPWVALCWLFGYRPHYWSGLVALRRSDKTTLFVQEIKYYHGSHPRYGNKQWFPPLVPILLIGILGVGVAGTLDSQFGARLPFQTVGNDLAWLGWYVGPVIYGSIIAAILLGNAWQRGGWPATKMAYRILCPDIHIVDPVRETASPQKPRSRPSAPAEN